MPLLKIGGEQLNPDLIKVMPDGETTKEDDLKKVKEEIGKCPECGAPCKLIDRAYQEEIHDVHYTEHVYQPSAEAERGKGAVWVKASDRLPEKDGYYCFKANGGYMGAYLRTGSNGSRWWCDSAGGTIRNWKNCEWLDESAGEKEVKP